MVIGALILFLLIWFGSAFLLRAKKMSWVISLGGSFVSACVLLAIPLAFIGENEPTQAQVAESNVSGVPNAAQAEAPAACAAIKRYFGELNLHEGERGFGPIDGPGIIASKPLTFVCGEEQIVIMTSDTKVDRDNTEKAKESIKKLFLFDAMDAAAKTALSNFFDEKMKNVTASSYPQYVTIKHPPYTFQFSTTQADAAGNFFLVVQEFIDF